MVNERPVHILLECILIVTNNAIHNVILTNINEFMNNINDMTLITKFCKISQYFDGDFMFFVMNDNNRTALS